MKNASNFLVLLLFLGLAGCKNTNHQEATTELVVKTPVTVSVIEFGPISESISLNATSSFLKKSEIRATANGFIEKAFVGIGDRVKAGSPMFRIKTKEAEALGLMVGKDTLLGIKGEVTIAAPTSGIVTSVTAQTSSYVNDGDLAAIVADQNSFVFILHVPYELRAYTSIGSGCTIILPDSVNLTGIISSKLAEVDLSSQTQSFIIKPKTDALIPEFLTATVLVNRSTKQKAQIIEKSCCLSDETLENFWVMKVLNDTTAVKVFIKTGLASDSKMEILSPQFMPGDRFVNSGSYGLPDTAHILITK